MCLGITKPVFWQWVWLSLAVCVRRYIRVCLHGVYGKGLQCLGGCKYITCCVVLNRCFMQVFQDFCRNPKFGGCLALEVSRVI